MLLFFALYVFCKSAPLIGVLETQFSDDTCANYTGVFWTLPDKCEISGHDPAPSSMWRTEVYTTDESSMHAKTTCYQENATDFSCVKECNKKDAKLGECEKFSGKNSDDPKSVIYSAGKFPKTPDHTYLYWYLFDGDPECREKSKIIKGGIYRQPNYECLSYSGGSRDRGCTGGIQAVLFYADEHCQKYKGHGPSIQDECNKWYEDEDVYRVVTCRQFFQ